VTTLSEAWNNKLLLPNLTSDILLMAKEGMGVIRMEERNQF